jgi:cytochrome b
MRGPATSSAGCSLLRLPWGPIGTWRARFAALIFFPATILAYGRDLQRGQARH